MTAPQILCLGEILLDRLADQVGLPLDQVQSWSDFPGGASANVACALAKLGTPAGFIGCVGQDERGDFLAELLPQVGVDTRGLQFHPTAPTRVVYVLRSKTGDREFAGFDPGEPGEFADAQLQAQGLPLGLFETAKVLVLGTLTLAYAPSRDAMVQALTLAHAHGLQVVMDVNWRPRFWPYPDQAAATVRPLLSQIDWLKLSKEEALWLFSSAEPRAIAATLPSATGIVVTDGDQGCHYWIAGQGGYCPAFAVAAVDTTGAGDSFVAGLVHQLCQSLRQSLGQSLGQSPWQIGQSQAFSLQNADQMIRYASAVGALTTLKPGAMAAQPIAQAVSDFLRRQGH